MGALELARALMGRETPRQPVSRQSLNRVVNDNLINRTRGLMASGMNQPVTMNVPYQGTQATMGDMARMGLEVSPILGDMKAVEDAGRYWNEGQRAMAMLSGASAIPGIGDLAALGKAGVPLALGMTRKSGDIMDAMRASELSKKWKGLGVDNSITETDDFIRLDKVVVPKNQRGQGVGSQFMDDLIQYADKTGKRIKLDPSTDFGGTSRARLRDFYRRFGFVDNKGKTRDFEVSEDMYREPNYTIDHRPMTVESGAARLDELSPAFGEDVYGRDALQIFGSGDPRERRVIAKLKAVRGKPDAKVKIYRGAPQGSKINEGDWVTLDRSVAQDYADLEGGEVLEMEVPAGDITSWADSLLEFGYYPRKK